MKPKIVSVKELKISRVPPPSEKEFIFLEKHGGTAIEEKTGFWNWISRILGK